MLNSQIITPMKRFLSLLKTERNDILSIYIFALFNGILSLSLPLGIQAIINLITGAQVSTSWILLVVMVIIGVALSGVLQIMQLSVTENLQQKIFTRSAFEFAYRIPKMKYEAVDNTYLPEKVNRFFDTLSVQKGMSKILVDFSSASLQIIFGLILLSLYHPFFILFSVVLILIVYVIFKYTIPNGLRTSLKESHYKYEVAHWLEELGRAMDTFKLSGNSPLPLSQTDEVVKGYIQSRKAHFKTLVIQYINLVGFKVVIAAGLLLIGSLLVINEQMNIGQFVASEIIIILVLASIEKLITSMETIYDVLTAVEKIGHITDIPLERDTGIAQLTDSNQPFKVELRNLYYTFSNEEAPTLKNINLELAPGEKVCLSGFGGSGKSILLQVIAGLYENFNGTVVYNDVPLRNWCKADLYSSIGDNLTEEDIFRGTLIDNITLGKTDITAEHFQTIARVTGLTSYIASLQNGYDTFLIPGGKSLPKNIRLKIILARSIINHPGLVLLEDNFNQLRKDDQELFLNFVLEQDWTVVAVSNSSAVAELFDRTIVMKEGEIIASGAVASMKQAPWYSSVFQNQ